MPSEIQAGYDAVAEDYAKEFQNEMEKKPFDRKMLDWLIEKVGSRGTICDLGCGPGQIAAYLHQRGASVSGIDFSAGMIRVAQTLNPKIKFQQGNMLNLSGIPDHAFAGTAAFYSIIHIPRSSVVSALKEINRVLCPDGVLLLTFHLGKEVIHRDEWWGKKVSIDFLFYETIEMKDYLTAAGFCLQEVIERDPYPEIEYPSRRAYIFANSQ